MSSQLVNRFNRWNKRARRASGGARPPRSRPAICQECFQEWRERSISGALRRKYERFENAQFASKRARHPQGVTRPFWWEQEGSACRKRHYLPIPALLLGKGQLFRMAGIEYLRRNCANTRGSSCTRRSHQKGAPALVARTSLFGGNKRARRAASGTTSQSPPCFSKRNSC